MKESLIKETARRVLPLEVRKFMRRWYLRFLRMTRNDLDHFYNEDFATTAFRSKTWTGEFCSLILRMFNPRSVIDVGCGTGDVLDPFEKRGIDIRGIDGSKANKRHAKIKEDNFILFDLRDGYRSEKRFDLCLCLEVAEHMEERYSDTLVESLVHASPRIVFTASTSPYGVDHINVHPHEWWIEKFKRRRYVWDKEATETLKEALKQISGVQQWYIDNLLVFKEA